MDNQAGVKIIKNKYYGNGILNQKQPNRRLADWKIKEAITLFCRFLFPFGFLWRPPFKEKRTPCEKANSTGKRGRKMANFGFCECQTLILQFVIKKQVRHENDKTVPRFYTSEPTPPYGERRINRTKMQAIWRADSGFREICTNQIILKCLIFSRVSSPDFVSGDTNYFVE